MKLKALSFAVATGIVLALSFFVATLIVHLQGGGAHLNLMHRLCPGYCVSVGGCFLGLLYGFVYGFLFGGLLALLYNSMSGEKA
ncbi:MAG: hypothetical protein AMJ46_05675 [Latescibacteria bacterium DG_63]|nr:MAG: hypothetical protein AMJ46_05675 [Latescibacteria bacterium DG_63]